MPFCHTSNSYVTNLLKVTYDLFWWSIKEVAFALRKSKLKRGYERPNAPWTDQTQRVYVFVDRTDFGDAADCGNPVPEGRHSACDFRLVLLPVLLFRVLRDRTLCRSEFSIFGAVVFRCLHDEKTPTEQIARRKRLNSPAGRKSKLVYGKCVSRVRRKSVRLWVPDFPERASEIAPGKCRCRRRRWRSCRQCKNW